MSKRISKKMINEFIRKVADKKPSNIPDDDAMAYYSKIDGAYFTREGMEAEGFKFLLRLGITEQLQNKSNLKYHTVNIGFNPEEQKWYGWSHRAIFGFGVGDSISKGDCAYRPVDKDDFLDDCVRFWDDENHLNTTGEHAIDDGKEGVQVNWTYDDKIPNKKLRSTISGIFTEYPDTYGKGEWTAKAMEDAKKMAMDFAEGVG